MVPVPGNNRIWANYRFYCDDDVQDLKGRSRWKLRKDPLPPHCVNCVVPSLFVPNRFRRRWELASPRLLRHNFFQEWEDFGR